MLSSSSVSKSVIANHSGPADPLPDSRDGRCVAVEMANLKTLTIFGNLEVANVEVLTRIGILRGAFWVS